MENERDRVKIYDLVRASKLQMAMVRQRGRDVDHDRNLKIKKIFESSKQAYSNADNDDDLQYTLRSLNEEQ
jgi:hypothetical protein